MNKFNYIIGEINAIQTLIENFPMNILNRSGNSNFLSPIDFVINVLHQIGVDEMTLTVEVLKLFFNTSNTAEIYGKLDDLNVQSEFLEGLEDNIKSILMNILTAILSCYIIPEIPDEYLDDDYAYHKMSIPMSLLDSFNYLDICPATDIGKHFYDVDKSATPNTTYKSKDLNAVIWYALNRGTMITQSETNKMMWDSRLVETTNTTYLRNTAEKWNYWLSSKTNNSDNFLLSPSAKTDEYDTAYESGTTISKPLHPIIQFYPNNYEIDGTRNLNLSISRQTFGKKEGDIFNKSIYEFNKDYLNNIQILSPKIIIANMLNELLNGNILNGLNIQYSIQSNVIDAQIDQIIKRALEQDDLTISDCFFSFSNDEFDSMLNQMEMERYGGKQLNSETSPVIGIENGYGLEKLNEINSASTLNERLETLTRIVYDISAIPAKDGAIEITDKLSLGYNNEWLTQVLMAIIRPIVKSLLSPKVMLLFLINFEIMGLVKVDDIKSFDDIMKLFYRKIFGAIISIVQYIKTKIVKFLIELLLSKIDPILVKYYVILITEKLESWMRLLMQARLALPLFRKVKTVIDDVNYADITQESTTPESTNTC